mmetsp:Transcript_33001/g.106722  ORF Transcript_33001/g.106722 Transcript_33001/m.106722 type:complete len:373 (+) Transcript_33001:2519-3637(+)
MLLPQHAARAPADVAARLLHPEVPTADPDEEDGQRRAHHERRDDPVPPRNSRGRVADERTQNHRHRFRAHGRILQPVRLHAAAGRQDGALPGRCGHRTVDEAGERVVGCDGTDGIQAVLDGLVQGGLGARRCRVVGDRVEEGGGAVDALHLEYIERAEREKQLRDPESARSHPCEPALPEEGLGGVHCCEPLLIDHEKQLQQQPHVAGPQPDPDLLGGVHAAARHLVHVTQPPADCRGRRLPQPYLGVKLDGDGRGRLADGRLRAEHVLLPVGGRDLHPMYGVYVPYRKVDRHHLDRVRERVELGRQLDHHPAELQHLRRHRQHLAHHVVERGEPRLVVGDHLVGHCQRAAEQLLCAGRVCAEDDVRARAVG